MIMKRWMWILLIAWGTLPHAAAQTLQDSVQWDTLCNRLYRLVLAEPAYLSEIDLSVGKIPIADLLRQVAQVNGINLCVKTDDSSRVTCNFKQVKLVDLLLYLCREYGLTIEVFGNIVSVSTPLFLPPPPPHLNIGYDTLSRELSYDLSGESLVKVIREISRLTGVKIVVPEWGYQQKVSGFSNGLSTAKAITALAVSNGFLAEQGDGNVWSFVIPDTDASRIAATFHSVRSFAGDQIRVDSNGRISIAVNRGSIQDIITEICRLSHIDYLFLSPLDRQVSLYVNDIDLHSLLNVLFAGTPFLYREEKGVYLFGGGDQEKNLISTVVIPVRYRTVEHLPELIPESLKTGMQIQAFPEQNSLIVSGNNRQIAGINDFLESIDQSVPLITIEVMIVDSRKSAAQEVGMTAGLGEKPIKTGGHLSPGIDFALSASSVNKLIHSFNGFGSVNLGKVTPNFYLTLKALEEAGMIEVRSTPKLSTLNGHEAHLKSGETRYYKEVQNNIMGTQNPIQSESYIWKSIEANLSLEIIPYVSQDGKITLSITIEQSEFTAREEKDAPPGTATRSFKSQIKLNNEEMVLLGGIDRNAREKSSSGLPFIARIPILKWLFGTSTNSKVDEKLSVFIKPKVIF